MEAILGLPAGGAKLFWRQGAFSDLFREFLRQGLARVDRCSLEIQEMRQRPFQMKFQISGKYEFQNISVRQIEWRIESTRANFPGGFYDARIGPKGSENRRNVNFGK